MSKPLGTILITTLAAYQTRFWIPVAQRLRRAGHDVHLIAFDDRTGKVLWKFQTGASIHAPPISYAVEGTQYIAVASGPAILTFALPAAAK